MASDVNKVNKANNFVTWASARMLLGKDLSRRTITSSLKGLTLPSQNQVALLAWRARCQVTPDPKSP